METISTDPGIELFGTAAEIKAALPAMDHAAFDAAFRRCIDQGSAAGAPVSVRFRTFEGPLMVAHDHLIEWGCQLPPAKAWGLARGRRQVPFQGNLTPCDWPADKGSHAPSEGTLGLRPSAHGMQVSRPVPERRLLSLAPALTEPHAMGRDWRVVTL